MGEGLAGVLPGGNRDQIGVRVGEQEPDELFSRITTCADDGYLDFFHDFVRKPRLKKKNPASVEPAGRKI